MKKDIIEEGRGLKDCKIYLIFVIQGPFFVDPFAKNQ